MAIVTENYYIGNREFTKTYSDAHRYVVRDGISYTEANDPTEYGRVYVEGEEMPPESEDASEAAEILNIILGEGE